jgi:hypothetical protein
MVRSVSAKHNISFLACFEVSARHFIESFQGRNEVQAMSKFENNPGTASDAEDEED